VRGRTLLRRAHEMTKPTIRTPPSRLIGVLAPDVAFTEFAPILASLTGCLASQGYSIFVAYATDDQNEQLDLATMLAARRIDGLILATASRDDALVTFCLKEQIPAVLVECAEENPRISTVVSDDVAAMQMAVDHLVALGHQNIGHIAAPQGHSTGFLRYQGFLQATVLRRLNPKQAPFVIAENNTRQHGAEAARQLLADYPQVTAIIAASDLLALGVYDALAERGLMCPRDLSVVGHNDMPLVDLVHPALTTIRINYREIGRQAADLLLRGIKKCYIAERVFLLPPELIIRSSTAAPRTDAPRSCAHLRRSKLS
jgi:LacI family transcriptional regulator, galactose operon repressor